MKVIPYVNFYGNCEDALNFYKNIFKASVDIQRYSEMPPSENMPIPEDKQDKIMHAAFQMKDNVIYFCDNLMSPPLDKSRITITVEFDTEEEIDRVFAALAENGQVTMPLDKQFWGGKFGSLIDQFGVYWAMDYQISQ